MTLFWIAVLYLVAAWIILQVADVLFPILGVPEWGLRLILGVLVLVPLVVWAVLKLPTVNFAGLLAVLSMNVGLMSLALIGVLLVAEGTGKHFDKGYIYFAMAFALMVELLNIRVRSKRQPA